ncbi:MAG TPA: M20/M25/M40 family metallo-hydrolase [Gemmatimonadales bacterium]|nr:M20/M25/M40 family metallo-hydrolase [Gemmatimonadales bacterium]
MQAIGRGKLGWQSLIFALAACGGGAATGSVPPPAQPADAERVPPAPASPGQLRDWLSVIASDSLQGRGTGTPGAAKAARLIAEAMSEMGLRPAGDSGFFQRVPLVRTGRGLALADSLAGAELLDVNVIGTLPGADSALRDQAVIVGAHYDHLGVGTPVGGDSIYNGADDDGSGVIATLAIARSLASGPPPKRTLIFLLTTGEELGLLGTKWYVAHPVVPLSRTVADLQIEMVGRPDPLVGGIGLSWLTGYERSTMGDMIKRAGLPIAPDPRPGERFFERSDNIAFARLGIPAHTLSSYGMHPDYHTPADDVTRIEFRHMARVVDAAARLVRLLADGPNPEWHPGGRP